MSLFFHLRASTSLLTGKKVPKFLSEKIICSPFEGKLDRILCGQSPLGLCLLPDGRGLQPTCVGPEAPLPVQHAECDSWRDWRVKGNSQLQCHCWAGGLSEDALLSSPSLTFINLNLCWMNGHLSSVCFPWFCGGRTASPHPQCPLACWQASLRIL